MKHDLGVAMALTGTTTVSELDKSVLDA